MASENLWRDSLVIMAIVVLLGYAAALALSLLVGAVPTGQETATIVLVAALFLAVLGLGSFLWRSQAAESRP